MELAMNIADEIERLESLRANGTLSEEEFQQAKARALDSQPHQAISTGVPGEIQGIKDDTYCMIMHLSQLLHPAGGLGLVVPIVMWAMGKDESAKANRQGIHILNWIISLVVYGVVGFVLSFILIGFVVLMVLGVLAFVFPIIGGIKANQGEEWEYPLTIRFIDPGVGE